MKRTLLFLLFTAFFIIPREVYAFDEMADGFGFIFACFLFAVCSALLAFCIHFFNQSRRKSLNLIIYGLCLIPITVACFLAFQLIVDSIETQSNQMLLFPFIAWPAVPHLIIAISTYRKAKKLKTAAKA